MITDEMVEAMEKACEGAPTEWMPAALTALEAAIPGLADVISGKAVIVPTTATKAMNHAAWNAGAYGIHPATIYEAMLAAAEREKAMAVIAQEAKRLGLE